MSEPTAERSRTLEDYGPLLVFFVTYKLRDIYWATGAFMAAATLALAYGYYRDRKVRALTVFTLAVVLVFGGMTIWLGDPRFIYIKPTIIAGLTGAVLVTGALLGRGWMKPVLGSALNLSDEGWRTFSLRFGLLSLGLAAINEAVWRSVTPTDEHLWVWFKFLGIPGLTLIFLVTQAKAIKRWQIEDEPSDEPSDELSEE